MRDTENNPRAQFPVGARGGSRTTGGDSSGRLPVNERSYRRPADPATAPEPAGGRDEEGPGYVIHLPIRVADLAAATALAGRVATSLNFLPELDAGETEVSTARPEQPATRLLRPSAARPHPLPAAVRPQGSVWGTADRAGAASRLPARRLTVGCAPKCRRH